MLYRSFTPDEHRVSQLGFGCMRFPVVDGDNSRIDEALTTEMLDYAIDHGVNYIDTAYPYHGEQSEIFLGEYFRKNGRRDEIFLVSKCPVWKAKEKGDFYRLLKSQLARLQTDRLDFYLLHALDKERWETLLALDAFSDMERALSEGLIGNLGFSFHDEYSVFEEILSYRDWDFCQIQLNYMDIYHQAGLTGLSTAGERGISVVIMEPVKGGKLAYPPNDVRALFSDERTMASHALRFLFNRPEVSVVLSGMSTMEQVKDNIATASEATPGCLSSEETESYRMAKQILDARTAVGCTACEYCLPCPAGVEIPKIFKLYNNLYTYGELKNKASYTKLTAAGTDQSACVACGRCESICPQHLSIIEDLRNAHRALTEV
ncbi:putative aldo/keto reductase-like oxidoreductase [Peptoniphilus ivorii]|uniref:aldo/keto reductase n=1 Tax=Aedoeadaptatus ivorii TaxID=54006 RepID=UPI00277D8B74|nr:aldo/keto reductase [Peptoniphilus ivorii]MDQ0509066.1 putative aldo/keto reductase-like oxidoreductase [Peptoniphilus ivorii]